MNYVKQVTNNQSCSQANKPPRNQGYLNYIVITLIKNSLEMKKTGLRWSFFCRNLQSDYHDTCPLNSFIMIIPTNKDYNVSK